MQEVDIVLHNKPSVAVAAKVELVVVLACIHRVRRE